VWTCLLPSRHGRWSLTELVRRRYLIWFNHWCPVWGLRISRQWRLWKAHIVSYYTVLFLSVPWGNLRGETSYGVPRLVVCYVTMYYRGYSDRRLIEHSFYRLNSLRKSCATCWEKCRSAAPHTENLISLHNKHPIVAPSRLLQRIEWLTIAAGCWNLVLWFCAVGRYHRSIRFVRFDAFTAVTMKCTVSWNVMTCRLVTFHRHFLGIYRLKIQGWILTQVSAINKCGVGISKYSINW
jgi:hypothetical protein